jgi:glutamate-1-semialdehyde 2,1-aminomutase
MSENKESKRLFEQAQRYLPGGVDSPVRAFKAVGGDPLFIDRGKGSHIFDVDGNEYVDYVGSWGPLILGHAYPAVVRAVKKAAERGTSFGAPVEMEITLARLITEAIPSIEMIRFVNSGTEATMSALRLARAFTNREKIIKFEGCYHGHSDGLLAKSGSGLATLGIPDSPGVPVGYAQNTLTTPYNDIKAIQALFETYPKEIAAVIVEPVAANMGVVSPKSGFLDALRQMTHEHGALLIFDEVITGFRVSYGGAQSLLGIDPDLTCLGKIIGGGLPVGAYGGKREIMRLMAPVGPVYQAGTLSGNPLAMAAGIETIRTLGKPGIYGQLEKNAAILEDGFQQAARKNNVELHISRAASLLTIFFTPGPVVDYNSAKLSDTRLFNRFFHRLQSEGIYWPPSQFEAAFLSLAHNPEDIQLTINACEKALKEISEFRA